MAAYIIVEYDDSDAARAWLDSQDYAELKAMRQKATKASVVFDEGV